MSTPTIGELERRISDLEARGEEWDEEIGMADGAGPDEGYHPYEDPTPSVAIGGDGEKEYGLEQKYGVELVHKVPGWVEIYTDGSGDYWLTSVGVRSGTTNRIYLQGPDELRRLATAIEEAER